MKLVSCVLVLGERGFKCILLTTECSFAILFAKYVSWKKFRPKLGYEELHRQQCRVKYQYKRQNSGEISNYMYSALQTKNAKTLGFN